MTTPPSSQPPLTDRRNLLLGGAWAVLAAGLPGCGGGGGSATAPSDSASKSHAFTVRVDLSSVGPDLNLGLLGHNVQWTSLGDGLLTPTGVPDATKNDALGALRPSVLRFPGGEHADLYHWANGIGEQALRTENQHAQTLAYESSIMGTAEFLDLCVRVGAVPLITVNVPTGTPEEAAAWVKAVNVTGLISPSDGSRLPAVQYWEIGNEPYLDSATLPRLAMDAATYADKATAIVRAMKAVDPSIHVGIPLSTDRRNGVRTVREDSWTYSVLTRLDVPVEFATTHNAYLPMAYDRLGDPEAIYWATMAGSRAVTQDLDALSSLIAANWGGETLPIALTEYHAIFSLGAGASDQWSGSPLAALYVVDLLRALAQRSDVLCANLWSLSENGVFGAIAEDGHLRPVGQVLALAAPLLQGQRLAGSCTCETVNTSSAGVVPAVNGLPVVEVLAGVAQEAPSDVIRLLLIHKDRSREGRGTIDLIGWSNDGRSTATLRRLHTTAPFRSDDVADLFAEDTAVLTLTGSAAELRCEVTLPPCCVAVLEVRRTP